MPGRKRVVLLGATGSIGASTLRVMQAHPGRLELVGVAACSNGAALAGIVRRFKVPHACLHDPAAAARARTGGLFPPDVRLYEGPAGLVEMASAVDADIVLVAVVGTAALLPTLAAIEAGRDIALASKEILVMAGRFVMEAARRRGVRILPVDSEHSGVWQCLHGGDARQVRRLLITASGGAFRDWPQDRLAAATPADALRHPNWSMGPKVTVDSATLANKGLELIEARWLFDLPPERLDAVIHTQSLVHALVEYTDGSTLAQLSPPSMTFAIQCALLWPERPPGVDAPLDFGRPLSLDFRPVDPARFPCFRLARQALASGGCAPAVFNAANEVAVAAFLGGRLPFTGIAGIIERVLQTAPAGEPEDIAAVMKADGRARAAASALLTKT